MLVGEGRGRLLLRLGIPVGTFALLLAGCSDGNASSRTELEAAFNANYIGPGDCLDGTLFDTANGAKLSVSSVGDTSVLGVTGASPASGVPAELHFTATVKDVLLFADFPTAGVLVDSGCPDIPDGF